LEQLHYTIKESSHIAGSTLKCTI